LEEIGESQVEISDIETTEEPINNQDLTYDGNDILSSVSSAVRKNFIRNVGNTQRRKFR
jgi:hypothetical protein